MSSDPKKLKLCNVGFINQIHYAQDIYLGVFSCKAIFFPGYRAILIICINRHASNPSYSEKIMNIVKREAFNKFTGTLHFKFTTFEPALDDYEKGAKVIALIAEFQSELEKPKLIF